MLPSGEMKKDLSACLFFFKYISRCAPPLRLTDDEIQMQRVGSRGCSGRVWGFGGERWGRVDLRSGLVAHIQSEITGNAHVRSHDDWNS